MNIKHLLSVLSLFVTGCSTSEKNVVTELSTSYQETETGSKEYKSIFQNKGISTVPTFVSGEAFQTKGSILRGEEDTHNKIPSEGNDIRFEKNETFSVSFDPEKAKDLINIYRKKKNLKPLKLNNELIEAAKVHSKDLSNWDRISHYGSDGSNPIDRVKKTGYNVYMAVENVGSGTTNFEQVLESWTKSPGQNKNLLLSEATEMGLALVQNPKSEFKSFWTLVIAAPI